MKPTAYITGLTALALAATASADVTINLTGATAFRSAALTSIKAKFAAGNGSVSYKFAHDKAAGSLTGSTRSIFIGNFPGVTGTTTIRCCFTGSVEGVRALTLPGSGAGADPSPPTYFPTTVLDSTTATSGGAELAAVTTAASAVATTSDIAFSDVNKTATPFTSASLGTDAVGVIVFTMMANEGSAITNVTSQQYRALLSAGYQPLSMFTGGTESTYVFAVGRNDGSGTRTTALAESGYGITNAVNQYIALATSGNSITTLQRVPAGGVNTLNSQAATGQSAANASTVWGQDVAGNGGYNSGGSVSTAMGLTGASVQVLDETGVQSFSADHIDLVTWLGIADAGTAKTAGAVVCGYNGVKLDLNQTVGSTPNTLSSADIAKITNGSYTAWGYERMFRTSSVSSDASKLAVYNAIKGAIPANLGTAGVPVSSMNVSRPSDGGLVAP